MSSDWEILTDRKRRSSYVKAQTRIGLPFQIRALRKQKGWSQAQLADAAEMRQPRISAIEKPGKGKLNIETLERIAAAFDVGLEVRFVSFGELIRQSEQFDPDHFEIPGFEEELAAERGERLTLAEVIERTMQDRRGNLPHGGLSAMSGIEAAFHSKPGMQLGSDDNLRRKPTASALLETNSYSQTQRSSR